MSTWKAYFNESSFNLESELSSEFQWAAIKTHSIGEFVEPFFRPEVVVVNPTNNLVSNPEKYSGQIQNTHPPSGKHSPNAQLYFNFNYHYEMEIHSLRCIFLDNFIPFNSIFTSSGYDTDTEDDSENYIFICQWNLVCPCWRLQNLHTFSNFEDFENSEERLMLSSVETIPALPYQEFKKLHKPTQFHLPPSSPDLNVQEYITRNVFPSEPIPADLRGTFPEDSERKSESSEINPSAVENDICEASLNISAANSQAILERNTSLNKSQRMEMGYVEVEKRLEQEPDAMLNLLRIPGTISDNPYEMHSNTKKFYHHTPIVLPEPRPQFSVNVVCPSTTKFPNSNLMLIENTLVAIRQDMGDEDTEVIDIDSSDGWATNVNPPIHLDKAEETDSYSDESTHENDLANTSSPSRFSASTGNIGNGKLSAISYSRVVIDINSSIDLKELEGAKIPENLSGNQNNAVAKTKNYAKHKSMFSWLKKRPVRQSVLLKYLFRGIGFGIAAFGVKPRRIGYDQGGSSIKKKLFSSKFKNRFALPTKVVPIDARSFGKSLVHEKLFRKRTVRRNTKSHKIIQNSEIHNFLPAKILKHNRVIPLSKAIDKISKNSSHQNSMN